MAESDEEVDVEDVSDGEQTNNLRGLGDDDQKDKWCGDVLGFICNDFSDWNLNFRYDIKFNLCRVRRSKLDDYQPLCMIFYLYFF